MSSLAQLKKRLKSLNAIVEIIKAMELIAATKLHQIKNAVVTSQQFQTDLRQALLAVDADFLKEHWLFRQPKGADKILYLLFGSERGLCGSLNVQLVRYFTGQAEKDFELIAIGSKISQVISRHYQLLASFPLVNWRDFSAILQLASLVYEGFKNQKWSQIKLIYPQYVNSLKQLPTTINFLPLEIGGNGQSNNSASEVNSNLAKRSISASIDIKPNKFIHHLLPMIIEMRLW